MLLGPVPLHCACALLCDIRSPDAVCYKVPSYPQLLSSSRVIATACPP